MAVISHRGDTDAKRHDKRHRHRSGGHAAGVKGYAQEVLRDKKGQHKHKRIKNQQHRRQRNTEQHTQQSHHQKSAHAAGHRQNQGHVGNGRHLIGQHLQIRLGYGDDKAQQKGQRNHHP